ncbi:MAG: S8 family serine peptidase [Verrucomicrobia bacterium]|nr:S8 family serine peptidase [Verrucomicrobiota bacterium]
MKKTLIAAGVLAISAILAGGGSGFFKSKSETASRDTPADHKEDPSPTAFQSHSPKSDLSTGSSPNSATPTHANQLGAAQIAERLSPAFDKPVSIEHGGALRELTLAKDELYVRNADGIGRVVSIPPAASASEMLTTIDKVQKETGAAPELILYPPAVPRNDSTRRIVTRDILIEADSRSSADTLASASGLSFKSAPVYAKGKYIYEAPSSPEALAFYVETAGSESPYVTPLLASKVAKMTMPNDPFVQKQWHLKFQNQMGAVAGTDMNVESVWKYPSITKFSSSNAIGYIRGNGVAIGIVDDGLEWSHPDLLPNVLKELQKDWNGKDLDPQPYYSNDNHGTSVAGVAAARGNNKIGVCGVAPEANLVGMRLIGGPQTDADIAEAMTWYPSQIPIKSNSWGYGPYTLFAEGTLTQAALEYAANYGRDGKGTILTFAAGNYDTYEDRLDYKGINNSMYAIAVGAVDSSAHKSYYSNVGPGLAISAPSDGGTLGIMTTDRKGWYGYNSNPTFSNKSEFRGNGDVTQTFGGTSSATPAVSGAIALLLQRNPNLGWRDVKEILMRTAVKIDAADTGWITANRTDHVTDNATVAFHFNDKYGAGLIDVAAAVALSGNWTNLKPQKFQTVTTNSTTPIGSGATVTRTFSVNDTNLRTEHVTLQLTVTDIPKGNLTITLKSPANTTSTFCVPHSDTDNKFDNWKFMTVRNWAESSNGTWTLSITNNGTSTGNLTNAELVVYGTEPGLDETNPAPVVTLQASATSVFVGSTINLTATTIDKKADGSVGSVSNLEAFVDGVPLASSNSGAWTIRALKSGNYNFTVTATDSDVMPATSTSKAIVIQVLEAPIAAWDFDTTLKSPIPLAAAIQSVRRYQANFGSGNLTFDGSFDGDVTNSNKWEYDQGQIFNATGTTENSVGEMLGDNLANQSLLLRGGKNTGAESKTLVLEFNMAEQENLIVSYAADWNSGGFTTHAWDYSSNGTLWIPLQTVTPSIGTSTITLNQTAVLKNSTQAYLRLRVSGATLASGYNLIDNLILSATPITPPSGNQTFTVISKSGAFHVSNPQTSDSAAQTESTPAPDHQPEAIVPDSKLANSDLEWFAPEEKIQTMLVHAEVVNGAEFLNAPRSVLSAARNNTVLGLAEALPQSTHYALDITSPEPQVGALLLRLYDAKNRRVLVMLESLNFQSGSTLGSPTSPIRYHVAYEEVEQRISLSQGWNKFTTNLEPIPSGLDCALDTYGASEGDRLVSPTAEAVYRDGAWQPTDFALQPGTAYSLLRQEIGSAEVILTGKTITNSPPTPVPSPTPTPDPAPKSPPLASASNPSSPASVSPQASPMSATPIQKNLSAKKSSKKSKKSKKSK